MDWFKNWFNFNTESTGDIISSLLKLVNPVYAASSMATNQLKKVASKWYETFLELKKIPNSSLSKELFEEKIKLINRGDYIVDKIRMMGLGADTLQSQLGAIPLIAVGVILSSAALMLYWTYDFIKFKDRLAEFRAARKSGASVSEATDLVNVLDTGGLFSGANKMLKFGVIIGSLFVGYKIAQSQKWIK